MIRATSDCARLLHAIVMYAIVVAPSGAFADELKDRFLREAPKAWAQLLERRNVFEQVTTEREQNTDGQESWRITYKSNGPRFLKVWDGITRTKTSTSESGGVWVV